MAADRSDMWFKMKLKKQKVKRSKQRSGDAFERRESAFRHDAPGRIRFGPLITGNTRAITA